MTPDRVKEKDVHEEGLLYIAESLSFIMNRRLKWLVILFVQRLFDMQVNWTWEALYSIHGQELGIEPSCVFMGHIFNAKIGPG